MLEVVWMTALGFALPAIGVTADDVVDSGYTRLRKGCGVPSGETYISGFSHELYGELFVLAFEDDDRVTGISVVGPGIEPDALINAEARCENAPLPAPNLTVCGFDLVVEHCAGTIVLHTNDGEGSACVPWPSFAPPLREIFARGWW